MPPLTEILIVGLVVLVGWIIWVFIIRTTADIENKLDEDRSKNFLTRL